MVRFWPKRCHRMPRSLYPAVVLQPEKLPIAFKFGNMPCGKCISPTDFLHQHPWCPKRCPASACAKREPPLCQFPVGTSHHCVECLACDFHVYPVSVTRFPSCPLQRRLAGPSQDNKNSSGMIIEYHWIISQNECPPSFHQMGRNLVSCKLQWFLVTSGVSSRLFFMWWQ